MSLKRRLKKRAQSVRGAAKRIGRKTAPIKAKIIPYVTAATAGVVSYLVPGVGSAAGLAISAAGAAGARYQGATAARARGYRGREARERGRALGKKTLVAGVAGTAAGTAGALAKAYLAAPASTGSSATGLSAAQAKTAAGLAQMAAAPITGPFAAPAIYAGGAATTAAGLATPVASGITFGGLLATGSTIYSVGSKAYELYQSRRESKEPVGAILQEPKIPGLAGGGGGEFDTAGPGQRTPPDSEKGGGMIWIALAVILLAAS